MPSLLTATDLLDQGATLYGLLGGFWPQYAGEDVARKIVSARHEAYLQTLQDTQELVEATGRLTVPVFHRERWYPLRLLKSAQLTDARLTYTATDVLGTAADVTYANRTFDWSYPANFKGCATITNGFAAPSTTWISGVDFILDTSRAALRFLRDPFAEDLGATPVYDSSGAVSDWELTLWLGQVDFDRTQIATQFGYILRLVLTSGEPYRDLLNAVWDAELLGPNREALDRALAALCDAPLARTTGEVVQAVVTETARKLVLTDRNVYTCGLNAGVIVATGQVLAEGDRLTDAFEVIDLGQGMPASTTLSALTVPTTMLQGVYTGGLTWNNALTAIVTSTVSSRLRVSWSLGGAPADATLFFDTAHASGILPGNKTLAQLLDTRPLALQTTEPTAADLPTYINPLDFLVSNVLRYGCVVVRTKAASFGPNALGTSLLDRILRLILGPQGTALVVAL